MISQEQLTATIEKARTLHAEAAMDAAEAERDLKALVGEELVITGKPRTLVGTREGRGGAFTLPERTFDGEQVEIVDVSTNGNPDDPDAIYVLTEDRKFLAEFTLEDIANERVQIGIAEKPEPSRV